MIMKKNNSQDGFTLIEVMIAIFILTIGILGAAAMQVASIDGNSIANRITEAATWGGNELEFLMGQPYDDPKFTDLQDGNNDGAAGLNNTDVAGSLADGGPETPAPLGDFTVFWNVADDYPVFGTKTIRVLVRRNDQGVQKTITQDFIMMRPI